MPRTRSIQHLEYPRGVDDLRYVYDPRTKRGEFQDGTGAFMESCRVPHKEMMRRFGGRGRGFTLYFYAEDVRDQVDALDAETEELSVGKVREDGSGAILACNEALENESGDPLLGNYWMTDDMAYSIQPTKLSLSAVSHGLAFNEQTRPLESGGGR